MSTKFPWKRGDVLKTKSNDIAVILDVFISDDSDKVILHVRFVRNIGDSRPYDTLEFRPGSPLGVLDWQPIDRTELIERIQKRRQYIDREIENLLSLVGSG